MRWRQGFVAAGALVALLVIVLAPPVFAAQSSSANYSVDQVFMGAGGELNACSGNYCAKQTAGEIAAGNTASTAFQSQAGFNVNREPYLAFSVAGGSTDLGYLSQFATATTTGTFAVKTYLANGYVVQLASDPPSNITGGYTLAGLTSPTSSSIGSEQFGINLVHNTSPGSLNATSADPVQVPDNTFSFGTVDSDYATPNVYKYVKGDTIASSNKSSGQTDYTISFIYNINNLTPDGTYKFSGTLVATSNY
ncbi:MAG TPA: hypothetical protein VL737_00290 [Candidatus Pristimantibacillus sp.]|jgi:hypothetical protein|nr:hypothetical protein [Candidatus Pristimantibacillus sp.]